MTKKIKLFTSLMINFIVLIFSIICISFSLSKSSFVYIYYDLNFISNLLSILIVSIFIIFQFVSIKKKSIPLFIYKLFYILISFQVVNLCSICYFISRNKTFDGFINVLSFISIFLLIINFLFFISYGKYIFLNSTLSLLLISMYIIGYSVLTYYKLIINNYLFIDFNNNLTLSIIYLILIPILNYAISSILLMYHKNFQELTELSFRKSKKYYLVHSLFK